MTGEGGDKHDDTCAVTHVTYLHHLLDEIQSTLVPRLGTFRPPIGGSAPCLCSCMDGNQTRPHEYNIGVPNNQLK